MLGSSQFKEALNRATRAGLGAVNGFRRAKDAALVARRVPALGAILGLGVLVAGVLAGAAHAASGDD